MSSELQSLIQSIHSRLQERKPPTLRQTRVLLQHLSTIVQQTSSPALQQSKRTTEITDDAWRHNVREFYERQIDGWRAIVSGDTEDPAWVAYVERGEVRIYASQTFPFIQDALNWCAEEVKQQNG
ncbi:MAG: hypothetical protein HC876_01920 [Chloroflexaceae bacterium]|nr:hypothetical protein [Chloroflexaceae bacterium]NJO04377.1 hypothetical protein [Chloroflexaceae bacterium]